MYKQTLYKIYDDHLVKKSIKNSNKYKKFTTGYNAELDCVIISKDGTLGEIYEIQGLRVGLPKIPNNISGKDLKKICDDPVNHEWEIETEDPDQIKKLKLLGFTEPEEEDE